VLECARIWARYASWEDRTTRPTRALVCALASIGLSTYKAVRRWLEQHGYLGTVTEGSTPWLHGPAALVDPGARNDAAVYVLAIPQRKPRHEPCSVTPVTRPPSGSRSELVQRPARAREDQDQDQGGPGSARAAFPVPATALRTGPGHTLSDRHVSQLARPFTAAGYSARDLAYAVDHDPSGAQHRLSATVRHPAGWLRWRLSRWLGPDGTPLPPVTEIRAAAAERDRAEADARRAALASSTWIDPAGHAAAIRRQLGWRQKPPGPSARNHHPGGEITLFDDTAWHPRP
jgi:hypothetical protein